MKVREVRQVRVLVPELVPDELDRFDEWPEDDVVDVTVGDVDWAGLSLKMARVSGAVLTGTALTDARWEHTNVTNCRFERVNLSSAGFTNVNFERAHFVGCQLAGIHFAECKLGNVLFENCRLDYAMFVNVRSTGPVAFLNCTLPEANISDSKLDKAVFDECRLTNVEFKQVDLRGADLRNNQLDTIRGVTSLRGCTVTADQLMDLSTALATDLNLYVD